MRRLIFLLHLIIMCSLFTNAQGKIDLNIKTVGKKANAGDPIYQNILANTYMDGTAGLPRDQFLAAQWYQKAAEKNYAPACLHLGYCFRDGLIGGEADYNNAAIWYHKAYELGEKRSSPYVLGECYEKGLGVKQDYSEAIKWYKIAAFPPSIKKEEAQIKIGDYYYWGLGVNKNYDEAINWYKLAANNREAKAQLKLGKMYYYGSTNSGRKNYEEAVYWFRKVADRTWNYSTYAEGRYMLGLCYFYGYGIEKNYDEAYKLFDKASKADINTSNDKFDLSGVQFMIGQCYDNGYGIEKNEEEASLWFSKAADEYNCVAKGVTSFLIGRYYTKKGMDEKAFQYYLKSAKTGLLPTFMTTLANQYFYGKGTSQDFAKAAEWYQKSVDQNDSTAMGYLGICYYNGQGVAKDYSKAFILMNNSANSQFPPSIVYNYIAKCYRYGRGVIANSDKADYWLNKAAENKDVEAEKYLERINKIEADSYFK